MGRRVFGRRTHRALGIAAAASLLVLALLFSSYAYAAATVRDRARSSLAARLGRDVSIGEVSISFSALSFENIEIEGLGRFERVVASFRFGSLFEDSLEVERIDVYGAALTVSRDASGGLSIDDIRARLALRSESDGSSRGAVNLGGAPIELHASSVTFVDDATETTVEVLAAHFIPNRAARSVTLSRASVRATSKVARFGGYLDRSELANVDGTIAYVEGDLEIDLRGAFAGSPDESWRVAGRLVPSNLTAALEIEASAVSLARLASHAASNEPLDPSLATIDANLSLKASPRSLELTGTATVRDLALRHRRIASKPISGITMTASGTLALDRDARSISVREGVITSRDVSYSLELAAELADAARADHPEARLSATLSVPEVPCNSLLGSIPPAFFPELQGFELAGQMSARVELAIDWADLKKTHFESDILADGTGINSCRVVRAPKAMSADRLRGSFEHRAPVGADWVSFVVGPENENYVPLASVSRNLTRSLITTEDSRFYRHAGFITKEFKTALIKNLERGHFAYGASSISMQVVKNVLLAREKTVSRKLEELFLTWYLERELTKDRILEIYVNAIEFGPGIYGIKRAAERYFNKHPSRLNPVESAFFSSILPAPVRRFKQYCRGWAGSSTHGKIDRILDLMLERNRLDVEQYLHAIETPLVFRGNRSEICADYEGGRFEITGMTDANKGATL